MKKIKIILILVIVAGFALVVSCNKKSQSINPKTNTTKMIDDRVPMDISMTSWAAKIVKAAKRAWDFCQGHEVIVRDGNTTSRFCPAFGTCMAKGKNSNGNDIGSQHVFDVLPDYTVNCEFAVSEDKKIIFRMHEDEDYFDVVFYDGIIHFLSHPYVVDDEELLNELGLTQPFTIQGGDYIVYSGTDGYANIIVDQVQ